MLQPPVSYKRFNLELHSRTGPSTCHAVQVHLATLNGQKVAVKVQRPGLKQLFFYDLQNVRILAQWLQTMDPKSDRAARDWVAIFDECYRTLFQVNLYTTQCCAM